MSEIAQWQKTNERYLTAALAWLRLCLERAATKSVSAPLPGAASTEEPVKRRLFRRPAPEPQGDRAQQQQQQQHLLPPAKISVEQITEAAAVMDAAAAASDPPPALIMLAQRFGLSDFERNVLLLCAAMEIDTHIAALCGHAQGDPARSYPTFALSLTLFDHPAWDVLSPERPLRHWRLIEINQPSARPLTVSPLSADEWVSNYIKGLSYIDDRLASLLIPLETSTTGAPELPPSQHRQAEIILTTLGRITPGEQLPVVQLLGSDSSSKQLVARHASAALNLHLYRLSARLLPVQPAELETLARLWQRQSLLLPVSLYLDAGESESAASGEGAEQQLPPLNRFLLRTDGVFFIDTREAWPRLDRSSLTLDIERPLPAEQRAAWAAALGDEAADNPARLSGQFNLNFAEIQRIAAAAAALAPDDPRPLTDRLWDASLASTRPHLDKLAQRLDAKATWDDLVLPQPELDALRQIANQVGQRATVYDEWGFRQKMNRGFGISALFSGTSGTGKTMAAEVLANELRLNLYRIDLSAVVSKYIGETEKNLRRLFDAAEDGGTILFFDEADAIFGKRSEVKDAHDRYANIEINYLLQRIESYRGLAILATNMKNALDPAFLRRLRFVVPFNVPGHAERRLLWQKAFPPEAPAQGLNFERLARLNLTGANIHNIALNAAFLAAHAAQPVTMPLVLNAARAEFRKLERPINEADFRWQEPAGARVA